MSEKNRIPLAEAEQIADEVVGVLQDYAVRVEVLGSIRRRKPLVGDIEILYEPKLEEQTDLLGEPTTPRNLTYEVIRRWRNQVIYDRLDKNGSPAFGERYQRVLYRGVPLDLFACLPPAHWGVLKVIRTGSADFNRRIVTSVAHGGLLPMGMSVLQGQLFDRNRVIDVPTEEAFFEAIDMRFVAPEDRK